MPTNQDIYQRVTDTILDALDKGIVPWHKPWRSLYGADSLHRNLISKKPYRGVNQFMCEIQAAIHGYSSPYWLSFKQVRDHKGKVRKGEHGTLIVLWKILRKTTDQIDPKTGKPIVTTIPLLKYYLVWNADQCDGITVPAPEERPDFDPIAEAQAVIDGMPQRPALFHDGGNRAYYHPSNDTLHLPVPEAFLRNTAYYGTTFHELTHATGHETRLGRVKEWTTFGSDPYAREELVAELGAAMLSATVGIETEHEQSAAYIRSWISRFQDDPKLIVGAAGQAQKAADFILGNLVETEKALAHA